MAERESAEFIGRHIGPQPAEQARMLALLELDSLSQLVEQVVPASIALKRPLKLGAPRSESSVLAELRDAAEANLRFRSFIGAGYYGTITPPVILRNILENPGWYTQYTPYQAEISQGRLEALLNFQTLICDLTGLQIANASLLDEGTAVAEAVGMAYRLGTASARRTVAASTLCHPQTLAVLKTRLAALGLELELFDERRAEPGGDALCVIVQYPTTDGEIGDYSGLAKRAKDNKTVVIAACDLLALTLLKPPAEWGADIAVGSAQRFGVPLGFGGPHAAFLAAREEFKRELPGRIVGVSKDRNGASALRLAVQTREQHIRREKATSNICTAQVLLAVMASMYAVYHGADGLSRIAGRIAGLTGGLAQVCRRFGYRLRSEKFFDTITLEVTPEEQKQLLIRCEQYRLNLRPYPDGAVGISLDETVTDEDLARLVHVLRPEADQTKAIDEQASAAIPAALRRTSAYLTEPVFARYRSETEFLRYVTRLQSKDLSLTTSMIPLGSCTMKLNATAEMLPVTWPEFADVHPFSPAPQVRGYHHMITELEEMLAEITGMSAVSLQPNAGSQGEYAGLLAIRGWHESRAEGQRKVCLIPTSAHGTNPASAAMAGLNVVSVACDASGNVDLADLKAKADAHRKELCCLMVTYPSTHGVFEEEIVSICEVVHQAGGQVYMDGANLNAQVGLCRPGDFGVDVCHLNLHKTFCIPHGGGGPGVGPIAVKEHLAPFLPALTSIDAAGEPVAGPVSAAPYGSASILPISWTYIKLMGAAGLQAASAVAILNANYIAKRLEGSYEVLYRGSRGFVAHECILDLRNLKRTTGIEVGDIAKRLMDYGFHAPTVSFPVPETLMVEPTESESLAELDRFCEAMIAIREEIREVEEGRADRTNNVLKNAPHTALMVSADSWNLPYSREKAAYPAPWLKEYKFWPAVARIDNAYGDRNLLCTCAHMA